MNKYVNEWMAIGPNPCILAGISGEPTLLDQLHEIGDIYDGRQHGVRNYVFGMQEELQSE